MQCNWTIRFPTSCHISAPCLLFWIISIQSHLLSSKALTLQILYICTTTLGKACSSRWQVSSEALSLSFIHSVDFRMTV